MLDSIYYDYVMFFTNSCIGPVGNSTRAIGGTGGLFRITQSY